MLDLVHTVLTSLMKHSWIVSRNCVHHLSRHACYLIGPDEPPQNVVATVVSSAEIEVSWEEVPAIDQNGIITMYEVQYEPLETFGDQIFTETVNITNASMLNTILTGLEEYVDYNITVRAYTSEGPGPYSDSPITERTMEDGIKTCFLLMFYSKCFYLYRTRCISTECDRNGFIFN